MLMREHTGGAALRASSLSLPHSPFKITNSQKAARTWIFACGETRRTPVQRCSALRRCASGLSVSSGANPVSYIGYPGIL